MNGHCDAAGCGGHGAPAKACKRHGKCGGVLNGQQYIYQPYLCSMKSETCSSMKLVCFNVGGTFLAGPMSWGAAAPATGKLGAIVQNAEAGKTECTLTGTANERLPHCCGLCKQAACVNRQMAAAAAVAAGWRQRRWRQQVAAGWRQRLGAPGRHQTTHSDNTHPPHREQASRRRRLKIDES